MRALAASIRAWWSARRVPRRLPLRLQVLDPDFPALLDLDAGLVQLAAGFGFVEGPVWFAEDAALLFSDIPNDRIHRLGEDGAVSVHRAPSHHANGLTRDAAGALIACEHGSRQVTRTGADGRSTVLASRYRGLRLNSPNDVVQGADGSVYFTDPPYGIRPEEQEQPVQGLYRIRPGAPEPELLAADFDRPNGLAFSPDGRRLYVADSAVRHLRVFEVGDDGSLAGGGEFASMAAAPPGVPDGLKVDGRGRLFSTGPGGVWVIDPTGRHLGSILVPETASNCAWGGNDWCSLFVTAGTGVYRVRVREPGLPVPAPQR